MVFYITKKRIIEQKIQVLMEMKVCIWMVTDSLYSDYNEKKKQKVERKEPRQFLKCLIASKSQLTLAQLFSLISYSYTTNPLSHTEQDQ